MAGWSMDSEAGKKRMAETVAFLAAWPGGWCSLKAQPWADTYPRFGVVHPSNPLRVMLRDSQGPVDYSSVEELVKDWAID